MDIVKAIGKEHYNPLNAGGEPLRSETVPKGPGDRPKDDVIIIDCGEVCDGSYLTCYRHSFLLEVTY